MSSNGNTEKLVKESKREWETIKHDFLNNPGVTIVELADKWDVPIATMRRHTGGYTGNTWLQERRDRIKGIRERNDERLSGILAVTRSDDVEAFKALETRLQKVVLSSLELLFPPIEAPAEAHIEATRRLAMMNANQLSNIINTGMRTLTETGRHRRLLSGQSTAIFGRAALPDIELPIPLEEAKILELRSRLAQQALNAIDNGQPLDVEFAVVESPEIAGDPDTVASSAGSPGVKRHHTT